MSNPGDELILGPETGRARDSDGDGVTDTQEGLDGTDPNDPNSLLRRVSTGLPPNGDPQGGPGLASLEGNIIVDVTANVPAGTSIEQSLPTGLDGKAIPTTHQHHGNADADKMFGTLSDANSPLNMTRNPVGAATTTTGAPSYGTDSGTMTSVGPSGDSKSFSGSISAPPAGAELGTRAPNTGLVSNAKVNGKELNTFQEGTQAGYRVDPAEARQPVQNFDKEPPSWWEQKKTEWKQLVGGSSGDGMDNLGAAGSKKKDMVDPDSGVDVAGGALSTEQIERAIAIAGADTDYVEGYGGGAQIEADGPPKRPGDLVTDGGADDPIGEAAGSTRVTLPGLEISKPINPQDDILGGPPPTGGQGGGQGGGGNPGRVGVSNAATAAEAVAAPETADVAGGATGVVNIGGGQTGGIATVGVEDGAGADADTDTDTDTDTADTVPDANAPIKDAALVEDPSPVEDASRMEDPAPLEDPAPMEDPAPAPVDPVADAMLIEALHVAPAEVFVAEVAPVDLLIRNEPGLDDGF